MNRVFTVEDLNGAIAAYRQQQVEVYKALDLLHGAIVALETLRDTPEPISSELTAPESDETDE